MVVKSVRVSEYLVHSGSQVLAVAHQALWLGILSQSRLDELTSDYYNNAGRYRSAEYNTSGLVLWEEWLFSQYLVPGSRILVAAAGGGREMLSLAQRGFIVDGFDCNESLVSAGAQIIANRGLDCRLVYAPPSRVPLGLGTFDAAIVGWGGYMHIAGREQRVRFLRDMRSVLHQSAPLFVSFFAREGTTRADRYIAAIANAIRRLARREPVEVGDRIQGSFDHWFTEEEIRGELRDGGFVLEAYRTPGYGVAVGLAAPVLQRSETRGHCCGA